MSKSKAVATQSKQTALAAQSDKYSSLAGAGMESVTAADVLIPRLAIVQQLSPQFNKKKPEYIPGVEVGSIVDVSTGEFWNDGVWFLPVLYRKEYIEWAPRDSGKGLVRIHDDPSIMNKYPRNDKNQPVTPEGNYIAETAQFFGLNLSGPVRRRCFVPMASSQLKKARKWMSLATSERLKREDGTEFAAPLLYRTYMLSTAEESNAQNEWAGWKIERSITLDEAEQKLGLPEGTLFGEAEDFLSTLRAGEVKADMAHDDQGSTLDEEAM